MRNKTIFILFSVMILFASFQKRQFLSTSDTTNTWTILMVDSTEYEITWDMHIKEASVYFFGKHLDDRVVKKTIIQINQTYKSEKKYVKEKDRLYKKGLFTNGLAQYFYDELERQFPFRVGFDSYVTESKRKFRILSSGDILKEFYYDGENFISKENIGNKKIKKYIIVKHYW